MEEYHHEDKVTSRIYASIAGWEGKVKITLHRREQKQTVAKEITAHVEERKRKLSPSRAEKRKQSEVVKEENRGKQIKESKDK